MKHNCFIHIESDFDDLGIGVALDAFVDPASSEQFALILYDAKTGAISNGSKIVASGEPYGRGDVITIKKLTDSVIFFKNAVIQGHRITGICAPFHAAVSARNCMVSLVGRSSYIRRFNEWNAHAQKVRFL
jgi:hypothetical protein